jgi:hypothetical protein
MADGSASGEPYYVASLAVHYDALGVSPPSTDVAEYYLTL